MDFSMFIRKFFILFWALTLFTGCAIKQPDWNAQYGSEVAGNPDQIQSSVYFPEYGMYVDQKDTYLPAESVKTVAVLLPLSGENAQLGKSISKSIELAFLQKNYQNISVKFFDTAENSNAVYMALESNPDIIIGPVFGKNVKTLRDLKPKDLPVLSFTSDSDAIGGGVMTVALMPTQSVEATVKEIASDNSKHILILAPKTNSGEIMAAAAIESAKIYNVPIAGMRYYDENDQESIKEIARQVSMWDARSDANTRARAILSDILIQENLTKSEKSYLNTQLDKISKIETLGKAPYDSVLLLGNSNDSKTMASFLRYFNVGIHDSYFYGTAMWDSQDILNDLSMSGSKFAGLPNTSDNFTKLYEKTYGVAPNKLNAFGFDAANLAIGMLLPNKLPAAYLLDPSGYMGTDGLIRLKPSGENERALQIIKMDGSGTTKLIKPAPDNFIKPIYQLNAYDLDNSSEIKLTDDGINPNDYINIPERFRFKYRSKTYGANKTVVETITPEIITLPEDDSEIIKPEDFKPSNLEKIDKKYIDSVEVAE